MWVGLVVIVGCFMFYVGGVDWKVVFVEICVVFLLGSGVGGV